MDAPSQKDLFPARGMSMTVLELFRSHALSLPSLAKFACDGRYRRRTVAVSSGAASAPVGLLNMTSNNVGGGLCRLAHFYDNMGALKALWCHGQPTFENLGVRREHMPHFGLVAPGQCTATSKVALC